MIIRIGGDRAGGREVFRTELGQFVFRMEDERLTVDVRSWGNKLTPRYDIAIADVRSIEFEETKPAETKRRRGLVGLVSREEIPARTGVLLTLSASDLDHAYFEVPGSPAQVRGALTPLVKAVNAHAASVVGRPSGDPVAQIERLSALHEAGNLTSEEFAEAKRRLLDAM